ncbi:MAG: hypothetical protein KF729_02280 [Sandaracinaceae bacterium]|nr:hypothetical protein [Sandaracinaceae bacterium]
MTHHVLLSLCLLLLAGCGFGARAEPAAPAVAFAGEPASSDYLWSRGAAAAAPDASDLERQLHGGAFLVPPDRALVRVDVTGRAPTRAELAARMDDATRAMRATLAVPGACAAAVVALGAPRREGERWSATATLSIDVPLAGLDDVAARFARVERCMERFDAMGAELAGLELAVSHPLPTVDRPHLHRAALLERAVGPLREVAAFDGPPAFDPNGVRCTSRGEVTIVERSLAGIALRVDLECAPRPLLAPAAAG